MPDKHLILPMEALQKGENRSHFIPIITTTYTELGLIC